MVGGWGDTDLVPRGNGVAENVLFSLAHTHHGHDRRTETEGLLQTALHISALLQGVIVYWMQFLSKSSQLLLITVLLNRVKTCSGQINEKSLLLLLWVHGSINQLNGNSRWGLMDGMIRLRHIHSAKFIALTWISLCLARKKVNQVVVVEEVCCPASRRPIIIPAISSSVKCRPVLGKGCSSVKLTWLKHIGDDTELWILLVGWVHEGLKHIIMLFIGLSPLLDGSIEDLFHLLVSNVSLPGGQKSLVDFHNTVAVMMRTERTNLKLGRGNQLGKSQASAVKPPSSSQYNWATLSSSMLRISGPCKQRLAVRMINSESAWKRSEKVNE